MKIDFKVAVKAPFVVAPQRGKLRANEPEASKRPASRPPRIAVLMALAIHMEQLLRESHVEGQAELAMLAGVTPQRVTQVLGLLNLAPDIQDALLFAQAGESGIAERELRVFSALADWSMQRRRWLEITTS